MEIRQLTRQEYIQAAKLYKDKAPWLELPPAETLVGKFKDGVLVAVVSVQRPLVVEALAAEQGEAKDLILWVDGQLAPQRYFFFSLKPEFKAYVQSRWAENLESYDGTLFVRKR